MPRHFGRVVFVHPTVRDGIAARGLQVFLRFAQVDGNLDRAQVHEGDRHLHLADQPAQELITKRVQEPDGRQLAFGNQFLELAVPHDQRGFVRLHHQAFRPRL